MKLLIFTWVFHGKKQTSRVSSTSHLWYVFLHQTEGWRIQGSKTVDTNCEHLWKGHLGIHWTLAVVDLRKKTIVYWDPMGQKRPDILTMVFQYLQDESKVRRDIDLNPMKWKQHSMTAEEIPLQLNQSGCGMFTCKYADYISREQPITFSQQHVPLLRKQMVWFVHVWATKNKQWCLKWNWF